VRLARGTRVHFDCLSGFLGRAGRGLRGAGM